MLPRCTEPQTYFSCTFTFALLCRYWLVYEFWYRHVEADILPCSLFYNNIMNSGQRSDLHITTHTFRLSYIPLQEFLDAALYMNECKLSFNPLLHCCFTLSLIYDFQMLLQSPEQVQWHNAERSLKWQLQTHPLLWEISQCLWGLCGNALLRITNECVIVTCLFVRVSSEAPLTL
jgi:hypothetical protein